MERESATILLQVQGPKLLQRLLSQTQTSDDLWDLWQDHHLSDVQPSEKQKMHYEKQELEIEQLRKQLEQLKLTE